MTTIQMPSQIKANFYGYQKLAEIYQQVKDAFVEEIIFDFSNTSFFDAHLAAVLGAILEKLNDNLNDIELVNFRSQQELILRKNDFLSHFGREKAQDTYGTTVQYKIYKPDEEKLFDQYVQAHLLSNPELPKCPNL
jgi:anti-anti-sigma regulatory factor